MRDRSWTKPASKAYGFVRPSSCCNEPPTRVLTEHLPAIGQVVMSKVIFPSEPFAMRRAAARSFAPTINCSTSCLTRSICCCRCWNRPAREHRALSLEVSPAGTVLLRATGRSDRYFDRDAGRSSRRELSAGDRAEWVVVADYVRSTTLRAIGPGSSGIDKLCAPYRQAWQLLTGTTSAMAGRFLMSRGAIRDWPNCFPPSTRRRAAVVHRRCLPKVCWKRCASVSGWPTPSKQGRPRRWLRRRRNPSITEGCW